MTLLKEYVQQVYVDSPMALKLIDSKKFWTIALLVQKAERASDLDLFFSAIRLSLPVFCAAHATEYVHISCDLLQWWAMASELEKGLVRKYGFTLRTGRGVNVGVDFAFEKERRGTMDVKLKLSMQLSVEFSTTMRWTSRHQ